MAELVKCSLCGRDVSSECRACPNCGHNVANELHQKKAEKERIQKENWEKQGLCPECGNKIEEYTKGRYDYVYTGGMKECDEIWEKCTKCNWKKMTGTKNWAR